MFFFWANTYRFFSIKTLVFRLSNKNRRMCLVGEIKSPPAVANRIFAAEIRTVGETWLFPSGNGYARVPRRAPISAKCSLRSKAISTFGPRAFAKLPKFAKNRRFCQKSGKTAFFGKNGFFREKRLFSGKTAFFREIDFFRVFLEIGTSAWKSGDLPLASFHFNGSFG